ncbi:MAG: DUF58 domain-containing protein [Roseibium sp.]|uniref:DUF58 domain-containing protein n=1 Tax=Roseibium sp. TaxID=1936156 RepID=UPI003D9C0B4F
MRDAAARSRTGLNSKSPQTPEQADTRVKVSLHHLRSLEGRARKLTLLPSQPVTSVLNGRHASRLRGRGLNFEELRGYLPGDDPRTIDWKVTARTGEAHVRVYSEERDRPALLVVDQRMSMFFGTRLNMKSVTAAEAAALIAFRIIDRGDRVGAVIFGDGYVSEFRPKRGRTAVNRFLTALDRANRMLHAEAPRVEHPLFLNQPLTSVARLARRDHLVIVISDFDGLDDRTGKLVGTIARNNDVILCPVTDPISEDVPRNMKLVVSDGELQVELDTGTTETFRKLSDFASGRIAEILRWQQKYGTPVLPLSAGSDTIDQLRRLMGLRSRPREAPNE